MTCRHFFTYAPRRDFRFRVYIFSLQWTLLVTAPCGNHSSLSPGCSSISAESKKKGEARQVSPSKLAGAFAAYECLEHRRLLAGDVQVRFEFTDLAQTPVSTVRAGDAFFVRAYVQDVRTSPAPDGPLPDLSRRPIQCEPGLADRPDFPWTRLCGFSHGR